MFELQGKLTFININQIYLKELHDVCSEVYYKPSGYDNKPYIGILVNKNDRKYVVPLSSAKEKHKKWKNVNKECYLIYEKAKQSDMGKNDIYVQIEDDNVKHILSVMDIKKMIPVIEGVYSRVNLNPDINDSDDEKKYKSLLNKEYSFCLKIIDEVIEKANKLYDKQINTGKTTMFCCDFKALETVADRLTVEGDELKLNCDLDDDYLQ